MVYYPIKQEKQQDEYKELSIRAMGRRIRVLREDKETTREELAEKWGITAAFLSDVEYGNKGMSIRNIYLLSQLLGASVDYLLSGVQYAVDKDEESMRVREEIVEALSACSPAQLAAFRDISEIYMDDLRRVEEQAREQEKAQKKFERDHPIFFI